MEDMIQEMLGETYIYKYILMLKEFVDIHTQKKNNNTNSVCVCIYRRFPMGKAAHIHFRKLYTYKIPSEKIHKYI